MRIAKSIAVPLLAASAAYAGPPFLTDDPVPVDLHQGEFYAFSTYDHTNDGNDANLPAFEYNYGALPDVQLHVGFPFALNDPDRGPTEWGPGDVELGVKYRFVHETDTRPQIAIFPMATLPTGNEAKGLGNGKTWWRLPLWIQKSWGEWTTYGGGGYVINPAAGEKNYAFGGWLLQKDLDEKWMLGGEVYARGADAEEGRSSTVLNFGGARRFSPSFNLLFSAGHSIAGESHAIAYLGLWWGFGAASE